MERRLRIVHSHVAQADGGGVDVAPGAVADGLARVVDRLDDPSG